MARTKRKIQTLATIWEVDDTVWHGFILPVINTRDPEAPTGRDRIDIRAAFNGIIYHMRTGCQWEALPERFGKKSSVHRTMQRWIQKGVFEEVWAVLINHCDELDGVTWDWQAADGALGKARHGGDHVGKNPTDRGKNGTKRSLLVEGEGGPLAVVIDDANVHDAKMLGRTIDAIVLPRPTPDEVEQHLCLDKGYDNPTGYAATLAAEYEPHVRRIGEERLEKTTRKRHPARRWVVERTIGWLNRCRAILVRFAKKASNYLGLIQVACILLWYRRAWRLDVLG